EATPAADRLRTRLLLPDGSQQIIPVVLAGVRSPSASKKGGPVDEMPDSTGQAEEFGDEARWFVESRLLQRNVKVEIMYDVSIVLSLMVVVSIKQGQCLLPRSSILQATSPNFWHQMDLLLVRIGCRRFLAVKGCRNFETLSGSSIS